MTDPVTLCVTDANILIDLHHGGILPLMLSLPYRCIVPDVVLAEVRSLSADWFHAQGFEFGELQAESVLEVYAIREKHLALSVTDLFALYLARDLGATLLTGDSALRRLAEERDLVVHGVLWVLDEMVQYHLLTPERACQALDVIRLRGAHLPDRECARLKKRWSNM
jgi:predicted nucleic acid-binding protein